MLLLTQSCTIHVTGKGSGLGESSIVYIITGSQDLLCNQAQNNQNCSGQGKWDFISHWGGGVGQGSQDCARSDEQEHCPMPASLRNMRYC